MRGPGGETTLLLPETVANVLSDGMRDGRVLIPSDPVAFDIVRRWAAGQDGFIAGKIADFAAGDSGRPGMSPEVLAAMQGGAR